jgi:hypothetical protein
VFVAVGAIAVIGNVSAVHRLLTAGRLASERESKSNCAPREPLDNAIESALENAMTHVAAGPAARLSPVEPRTREPRESRTNVNLPGAL